METLKDERMTRYTIEIDDQSSGRVPRYMNSTIAAFDKFEGDADPSYVVTHQPSGYPVLAIVMGRGDAQPSPEDVEALILPIVYFHDFDRVM